MIPRSELEKRLATAEAAVPVEPGKARWASGGVIGGGISIAPLTEVLTWMLPEGAPAVAIATILVAVGGLAVNWWTQEAEPNKPAPPVQDDEPGRSIFRGS